MTQDNNSPLTEDDILVSSDSLLFESNVDTWSVVISNDYTQQEADQLKKQILVALQIKQRLEEKIKALDQLVKHAENGSSLSEEDIYLTEHTLPILEQIQEGDYKS